MQHNYTQTQLHTKTHIGKLGPTRTQDAFLFGFHKFIATTFISDSLHYILNYFARAQMYTSTWCRSHTYTPVCLYISVPLSVSGAKKSSKQLSPCFARLMSAVNFNDTFIKIGADVSQLAESQIEESERRELSKIECTEARERNPELCTASICSCVTQCRTSV